MDKLWPDSQEIGRFVTTAGRITLDEESSRTYRLSELPTEFLPAGLRLVLKDIDENGKSWLYHDRYGVLWLPTELFLP
jgi:hypothetical protein